MSAVSDMCPNKKKTSAANQVHWIRVAAALSQAWETSLRRALLCLCVYLWNNSRPTIPLKVLCFCFESLVCADPDLWKERGIYPLPTCQALFISYGEEWTGSGSCAEGDPGGDSRKRVGMGKERRRAPTAALSLKPSAAHVTGGLSSQASVAGDWGERTPSAGGLQPSLDAHALQNTTHHKWLKVELGNCLHFKYICMSL